MLEVKKEILKNPIFISTQIKNYDKNNLKIKKKMLTRQ